MEKDPEGFHLGFAVMLISKKHFEKGEWASEALDGAQGAARLQIKWWKKDRFETGEKFNELYDEWKALKAEKNENAEKVYKKMVHLGIAALPEIINKIEEGDESLIPIASKLTDGAINLKATSSESVTVWEQNKERWLIE